MERHKSPNPLKHVFANTFLNKGNAIVLKSVNAKRHTILGVDIQLTAVKILELSYNNGQCRLENYGQALLPENVMQSGIVKNIDAVAQCIRSLLKVGKFSSKNAVVALPDALIMTKKIQVSEHLKRCDIKELVNIEIGRYYSESTRQISFDYKRIEPSCPTQRLAEIVIIAARTEHVKQRIESLQRAGLNVKVVDVESFAIERVIVHTHQFHVQTIAFLQITSEFVYCFVAHAQKIIFIREEARVSLVNVIDSALLKQHLLDYIQRACQFFYAAHPEYTIEQIILAGELMQKTEWVDFLSRHLSIPICVVSPFEQMQFSSRVNREKLLYDAPLYATACGLALRRGTVCGN